MEINPINHAKEHFKSSLTKGRILELAEIQLPCDEEEHSCYHQILKQWYNTIINLNFLPKDLSNLEEIFVHGPTNMIIKDKEKKIHFESDLTNDDIHLICEILTHKKQLAWNIKEPFVSFYSKIKNQKVRISLIHYSASPSKISKLFIRILNDYVIPISEYNGPQKLFNEIIDMKKNIIIAGATGSGKTTFTNSLLDLIPKSEHVVVIEDTNELLPPTPYTTKLLTDEKNENKSMNNYLSYALRMSPDRIILGEIRSKEAESSLLSMNTGHNGFVSTIHANSAKDAIDRLSLLFKIYSNKDLSFELVLKLIATNIDYVIFIQDKKVHEIIEVYGSNEENLFYESIFKSVP